MRSLALVAMLAASAAVCTEPVEPITEALDPSRSVSPAADASGSPSVVGDAISVEFPTANEQVGSPLSVSGTADVIGAAVTVRVLDENGAELAAAIVEASCGDGCIGTFATELFFFTDRRQTGTVEVSGASTTPPAPRVAIPVVLVP